MRRSSEARNLLAQLDAELHQSSAVMGEQLVWSAAEAEVLKLIAAAVARKCLLAREFDKATSPSARVALSGEVRLLEGHIARLLKQVRTDLPQEQSVLSATSAKAQKAVRSRWDRERMKQG